MIEQLRHSMSLLDKKRRFQLIGLLAMILLSSVLEVAGVGMIFPLILIISDPTRIESIPIMSDVYHTFFSGVPATFIVAFSLSLFGFYLVKNGVFLLNQYLQNSYCFVNEARLARRLLAAYLYSPYSFHLTRNSAVLIRNVRDCVSSVFNSVIIGFLSLATEAGVSAAVLGLLLALEPVVTLVAATLVGTPMVLFYLIFRVRFVRWGKQLNDLNGLQIKWLQQGLHGIKEIAVLGRQDYFIEAYYQHRLPFARLQTLIQVLNVTPRLVIETLAVAGMLGLILVTTIKGSDLSQTMAILGLFATAAFRIMPSANRMLLAINNIKHAKHPLDEVYADVVAFQAWREDWPENRALRRMSFDRQLSIRNVTFAYDDIGRTVLNDISLDIRHGEAVAFIGPSGSGKTTLVDIILGLLDPSHGRILVDGCSISDDPAAWQANIGYVPQTIALIDDTLRRNVALGIADEAIDDERLTQALRMAQLEDLIVRLPQGVDTYIGERGVRLSGGQRQRVGIARAIYHNPRVLVLDEATSALDNETEYEIARTIDALRGTKTMIFIAHRLSTVQHCDRLVFMKEGRIVDAGSFADLTMRNADFARLVELAGMVPPSPASVVAAG